MNLPIRSPFDLFIIVLLIVFGGFLIFGFAFGTLSADRTRRQSTSTRLPQSAVLAACALTWWLIAARSTPIESFARYVFLGMALGFVGDVIMAELLALSNHIVWNMLCSGAGAVFYLLALRELQILFSLNDKSTLVIALVLGWVVSIGAWLGLIVAHDDNPIYKTGALVYGMLLGSVAAYAAALAIQELAFIPLAVGASCLLIANIILGNYLTRKNKWHLVSDVIWVTYIFGQALIVFTNATVLTLMP